MSNQIDITGGARVRGLNGVITGTTGVLDSLPINSPNGIPQLDSSGKILVSQLPNSVMEYKGTWNVSTNTPTLVNGTGNQGDVYLVEGAAVGGTAFNFGAGPITFFNGDQAIYSGSIWQRASGATGTVTSVGLSTNAGAITISNSPITTSGVISANFNGTNLQYVNGAGNLTTFPTLITSIGLSMPTAFNVANSPLTANGTIAVTGAGTASQYIRGDGQLATFPTTGGGGSAIYYYLNGSIASSVAGYQQMANTAIVGAGTDFNIVGNGLIAQFLTDIGNPNRNLIPSGAWNFEMFFSSSSNGGNEKFYLELVKYNGSTFTTIASTITNPEAITGGTTTDLYITSMAVPETTLLVTDRLAIRVYIVDNSGARTITLHTEDNNLCQITTTFSAGISSINGLTENTQYFAVGTAGSDFNINSLVDTHTFNLPTASATKRGALSSADWSLFNGKENVLTFSSPLIRSLNAVSIQVANASQSGYLTSTDWNTFNNKQAALNGTGFVKSTAGVISYDTSVYVPTSRTLTINGTAYDLSADRSWTINPMVYPSAGIAVSTGTAWGTSLVDNSANWNTAYSLRITSATAPLSIAANVISIAQATTTTSGYLSSTDWNTFNGKMQGGGLTAGKVPFATGSSSLGDTNLNYNGGFFGFGTAASTYRIDVSGSVNVTGTYYINGVAITTGGVTGTGTTNYLPKFTGASTIGNSGLIDNGTTISTTENLTIKSSGNHGLIINSSYTPSGKYWSLGVNYNNADGELVFIPTSTSFGDAKIIFQQNGNVGIGTTTDAGYKLDVNGTVRVQGSNPAYRTDNTTSYTSLVSYLSGIRSWQLDNVSNDFKLYMAGSLNAYVFNIAASTGAATFSSNIGWGGVNPTGNAGISNTLESSQGSQIAARIAVPQLYISSNVSGTPYAPTRAVAGYAAQLTLDAFGGTIGLNRAISSTAGSTITWIPNLEFNNTGAATFSSSVNVNTYLSLGTGSGKFLAVGGAVTSGSSADMLMYNTGGDLILWATGAVGMIVKGTSGNVGIGTSSPNQKLTVNQGATGTGQGIPATSGSTQNGILRLTPAFGLFGETFDFGMNVGTTYAWLQATNYGGLGTNYPIAINPNGGNVLIGTTTDSGYKLNVAGTVNSTNVFRSTNGFMNSYEGYNAWELGIPVSTSGLTVKINQYVSVRINGTVYKLALVQEPTPP